MPMSKIAKILVVDDEKDICIIIAKGLRLAGFDVDSNDNALDVLSSFKPGAYDLIILDIKMPRIDGLELYKRIRLIDKEVRVCFLTAFDIDIADRFKLKFPYAGIPNIIRKPIELPKLVELVKTQLSIR